MIADWETNKVYYSFHSKYDFKPELAGLHSVLKENNFNYGHIVGTKDYFCRDYMPIQIAKNEFVQFNFKPDYLLNNPETKAYVTNTSNVRRKNKFLADYKIVQSEIILDGGNIVKSKTRAIITDKVFDDNKMAQQEIISKLENLLKVKLIIIPRYPGEETGHADGLIRFINENTVLTINLDDEQQDWSSKLIDVLAEAGLEILSLPKAKSPDDDWRYINYLHIGKTVIVPEFDNESDKIILPFLQNLFKQYAFDMTTLNASKIAKEGGVLNCFTWNIFS